MKLLSQVTRSWSAARARAARLALWVCVVFSALWSTAAVVRAEPIDLQGQWFAAQPGFVLSGQLLEEDGQLRAIAAPSRTGGRYFYQARVHVPRADTYVVDFDSSSTIGSFTHSLFDLDGKLLATSSGGIESSQLNPFFLRHGRELLLERGEYRLVTELTSPFLLAQPEPFLENLAAYRQAIKPGNALVLIGLGVFLGLGLYYAALGISRRSLANAMYAAFIVGNVLYNGSALQLFPDLFGIHWFYLVSLPILFSNIAYVLFVVALLEIRRATHPRLHMLAVLILGVLISFALLGLCFPNWSLELDRYGVGLFASFGLIAAVVRTSDGYASARMYLLAVGVFFVLAIAAISLSSIDAHTIFVEHLGLLAVVVEVCLLALVLAHQFALLHHERERALERADESSRIAYNDDLTGLPNRYQLDLALSRLGLDASLTFIDLDGLKLYNDKFGHQRGDELLRSFGQQLSLQLGDDASLYRLSGDEFAVTCPSGDLALVGERIAQAVVALRKDGFEMAGASHGSVHVRENPSRDTLKHIADTRMYEQKRLRRETSSERKRKPA